MLAGLQAGNAEVAGGTRARFDARQHGEGARVAGDWQVDDHILALPGQQQRCPLVEAAERRMGHGSWGSAAAAPGRQAR